MYLIRVILGLFCVSQTAGSLVEKCKKYYGQRKQPLLSMGGKHRTSYDVTDNGFIHRISFGRTEGCDAPQDLNCGTSDIQIAPEHEMERTTCCLVSTYSSWESVRKRKKLVRNYAKRYLAIVRNLQSQSGDPRISENHLAEAAAFLVYLREKKILDGDELENCDRFFAVEQNQGRDLRFTQQYQGRSGNNLIVPVILPIHGNERYGGSSSDSFADSLNKISHGAHHVGENGLRDAGKLLKKSGGKLRPSKIVNKARKDIAEATDQVRREGLNLVEDTRESTKKLLSSKRVEKASAGLADAVKVAQKKTTSLVKHGKKSAEKLISSKTAGEAREMAQSAGRTLKHALRPKSLSKSIETARDLAERGMQEASDFTKAGRKTAINLVSSRPVKRVGKMAGRAIQESQQEVMKVAKRGAKLTNRLRSSEAVEEVFDAFEKVGDNFGDGAMEMLSTVGGAVPNLGSEGFLSGLGGLGSLGWTF